MRRAKSRGVNIIYIQGNETILERFFVFVLIAPPPTQSCCVGMCLVVVFLVAVVVDVVMAGGVCSLFTLGEVVTDFRSSPNVVARGVLFMLGAAVVDVVFFARHMV